MAGLTGNTKDTGNVNVRTDFVWGSLPMQPNDDRGGNTLDLTKGNHSLAANDWQAYPLYTVGGRGTKHKKVPSMADQRTKALCIADLKAVGFEDEDILFAVTDVGATAKAYGTFASSSPAATVQTTNPGDPVTVTLYGSTMVSVVKTNVPAVKTVLLEPDATCHVGNATGTIVYYDWEVIDLSGKVTKYRKTAATGFNHVFTTVGVQTVYLTITNSWGRSLKSAAKNFTTT